MDRPTEEELTWGEETHIYVDTIEVENKSLREQLEKEREEKEKYIRYGYVYYANNIYKIAGTGPHGLIKIYDEPPCKHTDLIHPDEPQ